MPAAMRLSEVNDRPKGNVMPEIVSPPASRTARPTLAADIIIANAPDPVFVCDLEGKILEANDAVSRLLGLRRDEVLEQSISRFLGQDEAREFVVALREVVERDGFVFADLLLDDGVASPDTRSD